jgi:hypothetical protein
MNLSEYLWFAVILNDFYLYLATFHFVKLSQTHETHKSVVTLLQNSVFEIPIADFSFYRCACG